MGFACRVPFMILITSRDVSDQQKCSGKVGSAPFRPNLSFFKVFMYLSFPFGSKVSDLRILNAPTK